MSSNQDRGRKDGRAPGDREWHHPADSAGCPSPDPLNGACGCAGLNCDCAGCLRSRGRLEAAAREMEAELGLAPGAMGHGVAVITPAGRVRTLNCGCTPCLKARQQAVTAARAGTVSAAPERITWPPEPAAGPPGQPEDPAGEIESALREFDTWLAGGPHIPDELNPERVPAGMCRECHLGPEMRNGRCFWCQLALDAARGRLAAEHGPDHEPCPCRSCQRRARNRRLALVLAAWLVLVLCWFTAMGIITWNLTW